MDIKDVIAYLRDYDGDEIKIMEVCGTHTSSIFKNGIRSIISPKIHLISGPGCPVCVTPASYIDKCIEWAKKDNAVVFSFGDMLKVPGTVDSLSSAKGDGAKVQLMFSPLDAVNYAADNPDKTAVIAAVGFETTVPTYALALEKAIKEGINNIKLVTALKMTFPAITWICENEKDIDGFLCPGHVSVITGSDAFKDYADKYHKPFVVSGFEGEHILAALYDIVKQLESSDFAATNRYKNAVRSGGNLKAAALINKYFAEGSAMWRGLGEIPGSGLYLREEYKAFDGGSFGLIKDAELPKACRCADVITGRINPCDCPMFGKACTPMKPYGPCMVSAEGACGIWYRNI